MDASPSTCFQQPQPSAAVARVVSVEANGSFTTVWTFDTNVASVDPGGPPGLTCNGDDPQSALITGAKIVNMDYPNPVSVGDGWDVDPGYSLITFAGGKTLQHQSGGTIP